MSHPEVADGLNSLFKRRSKFVLIGLTGRTGSGCSQTAKLLSMNFDELKLPENKLIGASAEDRKHRIVRNYLTTTGSNGRPNKDKPWTGLSGKHCLLPLDIAPPDVRILITHGSGNHEKTHTNQQLTIT